MMTEHPSQMPSFKKYNFGQLKAASINDAGGNTDGSADGNAAESAMDHQTYQAWRAQKLKHMPQNPLQMMVEINNLAAPTNIELEKIAVNCTIANFSFYKAPGDQQTNREDFKHFAEALGLKHNEAHRSAGDDGIVALELSNKPSQVGYIPYTNRPLSWHTDGYYNYHGPDHAIRAMAMHCVRPAHSGGENAYLDPDIAYIRLRDENPDYISALMSNHAMTIPENREEGGKVRPTNEGPVFFIDGQNQLNMRFTARKRNIIWQDNPITQEAVQFLSDILLNDPAIIRYRLKAGEGVICNNILHNRTGFDKDEPDNSDRLLYRARYYQRVADQT